MTNVRILDVFRTHAQNESGKVCVMKSTLHFSAFTFLKKQCIYSKLGLNGTQYNDVKLGVGIERARCHGIVSGKSL